MIFGILESIVVYMFCSYSLSIRSLWRSLSSSPCHNKLGFIPTKKITSTFHKNFYSTSTNMASSDNSEEVTVFHKIVAGELPCKKVYEDDLVLAFYDIEPVAPSHILLIPKQMDGLSSLSKATDRHKNVLGHMMVTAAKIAKDNDLGDFRVVINNGPVAQQTVFYLHIHLMSGRKFNWPPG